MTRIEPYSDKEVKFVLENLLKDKEFLNFVKENLNSSTSKFLSIPGSNLILVSGIFTPMMFGYIRIANLWLR